MGRGQGAGPKHGTLQQLTRALVGLPGDLGPHEEDGGSASSPPDGGWEPLAKHQVCPGWTSVLCTKLSWGHLDFGIWVPWVGGPGGAPP